MFGSYDGVCVFKKCFLFWFNICDFFIFISDFVIWYGDESCGFFVFIVTFFVWDGDEES